MKDRRRLLSPAACLCAGLVLFLATAQRARGDELALTDIGTPGTPSTAVTDVTGTTITTTARGLAAVSSQDELAYLHQELRSSGTLEWTQATLGSGQAGRCDGLMVRRSVAADSAMVYFGYQNDGTGTPKVVLAWRSTDGGSLVSKIINDTPLRDTMGVLRLSLEWIRGKVVAKYYSESADAWKPLYALDLEADTPGAVLGGFARASGTSAASWGALLASDAEAATTCHPLDWAKVSEPQLDGIAARVTTFGSSTYTALDPYGLNQPIDPGDWTTQTQAGLTGGDHFSIPLDATYTTSVGVTSVPCALSEAVDVFARWGSVGGSTASANVGFEIYGGPSVLSGTVNQQQDDNGLWVYLDTVPASTSPHGLDIYLDAPAAGSGHLAVDGFLILGRSDQPDLDGDALADAWESTQLGAIHEVMPDHDADGDGLTNAQEFAQGTTPTSFDYGLYADPPTLTMIGSTTRKAPIGLVCYEPLQVQAVYDGTAQPVSGYRVTYTPANSSWKLSTSLEQPGVAGWQIMHTDGTGVASAYLTVPSAGSAANVTAGSLTFTITPYEDTIPGPMELYAHKACLIHTGGVTSSGQMAAHGPWLAVGHPEGASPTLGSVQLYKWDATTGAWTASHTLLSPAVAPASDGYGTSVKLCQDVLAVHAPADDLVYLYERAGDSEFWELKEEITVPATMTDFAVSHEVLAVGDAASDEVTLHKRTGTGWVAVTPTLEADTLDAPDMDFGWRVGFSEDGASMYISAPAAETATTGTTGKVHVYSVAAGGVVTTDFTLTGPSTAEERRFGNAVALAGDRVVVGAPMIPALAGAGEYGRLFVYEDNSGWLLEETITGASADFASYAWSVRDHVLTGYHQGTPAGGSVLDVVALYQLTGTGPELLETLPGGALFIHMEADSVFLAGTGAGAGIAEHRLSAQMPSNSIPGDPVGELAYHDLDDDIYELSLSQPGALWSLTGTYSNEVELATGADLSALEGTVELFSVSLRDLAGSVDEGTFLVSITGPAPAAPTTLAAAVLGIPQVGLTWQHDGSGGAGLVYRLERANLTKNATPTGSESFSEIAVLQGWARFHADTTVTALQDYVYRMRAEGDAGLTSYSNLAALHWDADADNMPDWWEAAYGGDLNPTADADGDGRNNLTEYTSGTSPLLADTDTDGDPDPNDPQGLDFTANRLGLLVYTPLVKP